MKKYWTLLLFIPLIILLLFALHSSTGPLEYPLCGGGYVTAPSNLCMAAAPAVRFHTHNTILVYISIVLLVIAGIINVRSIFCIRAHRKK